MLLATLSANAITSFSIRPLQLFSIAGCFALLGTFALAACYLAMYLFGQTISGLTTVYLLLLANLALTLLGIGVLGEYVGRIYIETKRRPFFLVDRTVNLACERLQPGALHNRSTSRRKPGTLFSSVTHHASYFSSRRSSPHDSGTGACAGSSGHIG